tara:strand:+ start:452 stop:610 length:159 start_codon:yes stop_codon:yes gene_type:complete
MSLGVKGQPSAVADKFTDMSTEIIEDLLIEEGLEPTDKNVDEVWKVIVGWYK